MAKRILTCKNHPHLRWATKPEAWSGFYNGARNIFYNGTVGTGEKYPDGSGFDWKQTEPECSCPSSDLILAPEDKEINPEFYK